MKINRADGTLIGEWESVNAAVASEANLSGADLRWANLRGANLRGADLRGADLRGANLRGANLRGADLSDADLRWANLSNADLSGADLRGANLRGVKWNNASVTNAGGAPWHFGLGRHVAIVHDGSISIGCMTLPVSKWQSAFREIGQEQGYTPAEIEEYGAWIAFVAERLVKAKETK